MPTPAPEPTPIEPLFANNERLWLRVWATTQSAALLVALSIVADRGAGLRDTRTLAAFALLVAYHAIGVRGYTWILRHGWAVLLYVPLGWALILTGISVNGAFGLLILGAIIQGFLFLPFSWAIAVLGVVVTTMITNTLISVRPINSGVVARLGAVLATGIMIGTVMLYIHRVNRDARIRARLLMQLDEAQRDLADRAREAGVQEERQRLARDIHDTLAQGFTSVIKHLEAVELSFRSAGVQSAEVMPHLANAQSVSRSSLAEIRRLVWALQPPQLADATLAAAIERIVAQWSGSQGIAAGCTIEALPAFQPDADVIFLRATQESLSNVARHAEATTVSVTFTCVDGLAMLTIEDNGRGFANVDETGEKRFGLRGMRERVLRFGGRVLIDSEIGAGTSITVAIPMANIALGST